MKYYKIPNLSIEKVVIIGGGPSLRGTDWSKLRDMMCFHNYYVIGTNAAYKTGICNCLIFGDKKFWDWNNKELVALTIPVICVNSSIHHNRIHTVCRLGMGWVCDREKCQLAWNLNSGAAAINLAYLFGAKKILLLGYDMRTVEGKNNFHDFHKRGSDFKPKFEEFLRRFRYVAEGVKQAGIEVINCTPGSSLPYFPIMSLKEALKCPA